MLLKLEVTEEEARFLRQQLERRMQALDDELIHTDKHSLQHALVLDENMLSGLIEKIETAVTGSQKNRSAAS